MKKAIISISLIIILIPSYIIGINYLAENSNQIQNSSLTNKNNIGFCNASSCENLEVLDSVGIQIKRNRWYGEIIINSRSEEYSENLYLFNLIKIPIKKDENNFITFHIIFITLIFTILLVGIIWDIIKRRKKGWGNSSDYYYI